MAAVSTAADFLALLQKSRLFSREQFTTAVSQHGLEDMLTAEDVADGLVSRGLLTRYQANRLLAGSRRGLFIDDYKIVDILGFGGMGYLYSAEELKTGWKVALKVLSGRYRHDSGMLSRFRLEAEAGLKLSHPNILRTKALNSSEDIYGVIHYMVLELVRGISLHELLTTRKRTIPWRQACDIILQAASGLHYAHEQGLVHRDVKPENLMIRTDGMVKVLDFGLAMIERSEAEFSLAAIHGQDCLGTADYIAPEQSFDSLHVDRRADIYSLGCTFYCLVTGRTPFPADSVAAKLAGHRQGKAPPACDVNPTVPERLSRIIQKMMAKRPENRFQTAAELSRFLEPLAERQPVDFDLDAILAVRAEAAEERLKAESFVRGDSRATSMSKLNVGKSRGQLRPNGEPLVEQKSTPPREER
jgi:eukaryotic-like serine/threonine-protein kinase